MTNKKHSFYNKSTYNKILRLHFNCLHGMYCSEYTSRKGYVILFNNFIKSYHYNYVSLITQDINEVLLKVQPLFKKYNRQLTLYITPFSYLFEKENLIPKSFIRRATDTWMILSEPKFLKTYNFTNIISIEPVSPDEHDIFLKTFISAYGGDNTNNQHSEILNDFAQSMKQLIDTPLIGFNKVNILAKVNDKPVGVASMVSNKYAAGIYGLGTIEKYRNCGIGSSLMAFLTQQAIKLSIQTIFLQTEEGSMNEIWYRNIGFKNTFPAKYFVDS